MGWSASIRVTRRVATPAERGTTAGELHGAALRGRSLVTGIFLDPCFDRGKRLVDGRARLRHGDLAPVKKLEVSSGCAKILLEK